MKTDKKNVIDLVIAYYSLENNVERFVFYFYQDGNVVNKDISYVSEGDYSTFLNKFKEIVDKNSYEFSSVTVYSIVKDIFVETIKFPLRKFNNYQSIVNNALKERFGSNFQKTYNVEKSSYSQSDKMITYKQIVENKKYNSSIEYALKLLGIKKYTLCNLPTAFEDFLGEKTESNRIVLFFEASFGLSER